MENKERILECALELFYAKGYDAVGVQEIAEKSGITKPTLYYYFGSKFGLLETLMSTKYSCLKEKIEAASYYDGDVPQTLYRTASAYLDYAAHENKMCRLMMALFYSARENEAYLAVKPLITDFYNMIVGIFERASEKLGNMRGRQEQFAIGFIGILNHYILLAFEQRDGNRLVDEEIKKSLVDQFMYGIYS